MAIRFVGLRQAVLPSTAARSIYQGRLVGEANQGVVGEDEEGGFVSGGPRQWPDGRFGRTIDDRWAHVRIASFVDVQLSTGNFNGKIRTNVAVGSPMERRTE